MSAEGTPPFNAREWVTARIPGAADLRPETWEVVSGFTVLWNLFEAQKCKKEATVTKIEARVNDLGKRFAFPPDLNEPRAYWLNRYFENGAPTNGFNALKLEGPPDRTAFVRDTFLNPASTPRNQFIALLLIVYRLRNNLFHGEKEIPNLNEQVNNLEHANRVLATAISCLPSYP